MVVHMENYAKLEHQYGKSAIPLKLCYFGIHQSTMKIGIIEKLIGGFLRLIYRA
jgi:hypothetical protein